MAYDVLTTFTETGVSANKQGSAIKIGTHEHAELFIDVTNLGSNGDETLDIAIEESDDDVTYNRVLSVPQFDATGKDKVQFATKKEYVRYTITVAGTSPSVDAVLRFY